MKVIFATGNANKVKEIKEIFKNTDFEIVSLKEAGINVDIVEDGTTFEENALIKARTICAASGEPAMADDSGLEVDALNKEPGIYSARYMGEDTSYDIKNNAILERMKDVPFEKRTARFVCAAALVFPDGRELVERGTIEGVIGYKTAGTNGFGYDPIFYLPERDKTTAELTMEEKNEISHRGRAFGKLKAEFCSAFHIEL